MRASLLALVAALAALPARAQEPAGEERSVALDVFGPTECPDQRAVILDVERFLGRPMDGAGVDAGWRIEARFTTSSQRYDVVVSFDQAGERWTRALHDADCALLGEAASFVIATAIDPVAVAETGETPSGGSGAPTDESAESLGDPEEAPVTEAPEEEEEDEREREDEAAEGPADSASDSEDERGLEVGAALRAAGVLSVDGPPGVSGGVEVALALRVGRRGRVEGSFRYLVPTRADAIADPSAGVRVGLITGAITGCVAPIARTLELHLCLGASLGMIRGTGEGLIDPETAEVFWLAPKAELVLAASLGAVAPWLSVGAEVPLFSADFNADGLGTLYRPSAVVPLITLGLELRLP